MSDRIDFGERPDDTAKGNGPPPGQFDGRQPPDLSAEADEFAEALGRLPDLARRCGKDSPEVREFIKDHAHLPEFEEYAQECLRIEFAPRLGPMELVRHGSGTGSRPSLLGLAAGSLVAASIAACVVGSYAVSRWTEVVSKDFEAVQAERNAQFARIEAAQQADAAKREQERLELKDRARMLADQLASMSTRAEQMQKENFTLKASLKEKDRSLAQANLNLARLESDVAKLNSREEQYFAQFKNTDWIIKTSLTTNIQSIIADAGLLRLTLRDGQSARAIEAVRKTTENDLAVIKDILGVVTRSISAADSEGVSKNANTKMIEDLCNSTASFADDYGQLDPLDGHLTGELSDQVVAAALLNYGFKKQLYALEMTRASVLVRDEELLRRILAHAVQLESSAKKIRESAIGLAPPHAADYIKARDDRTQAMITAFRSLTKDAATAGLRPSR